MVRLQFCFISKLLSSKSFKVIFFNHQTETTRPVWRGNSTENGPSGNGYLTFFGGQTRACQTRTSRKTAAGTRWYHERTFNWRGMNVSFKKVFCFVCLLCLKSSLLSLIEIQNNAHVLRVKMEVSFALFAWWHTTDPCLTKTFALFLRFIASWMFHAVCMCYMFASMNNGYIVYHAFHGLHIILRFKLFLFLRSLLTVPWNTMYNKAILVFSLYCRSWSKTTRRKPSVPHKQLKNIATKPCLKWRRRSTE